MEKNIKIKCISKMSHYRVEAKSNIGGREEQQDSAFVLIDEEEVFAVVCDGMGGEADGAFASQKAVAIMEKVYLENGFQDVARIPEILYKGMVRADSAISKHMESALGGTTMVAAAVTKMQLHWLSVGDSRLYIVRENELLQVTRDHNYLLRLTTQLQRQEISMETFEKEKARGAALLSFVGRGEVSMFDLTQSAFLLQSGDILLLTTDGTYQAVPRDVMRDILVRKESLEKRAEMLMAAVEHGIVKKAQDNTTFVMIEVL